MGMVRVAGFISLSAMRAIIPGLALDSGLDSQKDYTPICLISNQTANRQFGDIQEGIFPLDLKTSQSGNSHFGTHTN